MTHTALYLAAIAVSALEDVEIVATRPPFETTPDFLTGGVLDSQGRHWVVKYPRHQLAGTSLEAEASLADGLISAVDQGRLPFDVVRPKAFTTVKDGGRAMVFREPYGKSMALDTLTKAGAQSIGRALGSLHELDPQVYVAGGVPVYDSEGLRRRLQTELEDVALTRMAPSSLLGRWDEWIADDSLWQIKTVPVHGDMDEDNVLWANGQVSAITSFGDAHVGDPAEDFVWLSNSLDDDLFDVVTESYAMTRGQGGDAHLLERVLLHSEFALARWLLHGTRISSDEIIADARAMLIELDETIAADPDDFTGPRWQMDVTETVRSATSPD
ncbi:phosphotransferase [Flaviflexus equikiangi]|uniref:Phosphotransferase n=1 Tax=Flaviflexus equikiangi TaxID=2758573 RepID=A0ABS2TE37_9ACTO|nr:phosphotransferase [Flaviflexus equikiangi]MBM9432923.1 phosphotransferase [Flaviflexus equikiangi]